MRKRNKALERELLQEREARERDRMAWASHTRAAERARLQAEYDRHAVAVGWRRWRANHEERMKLTRAVGRLTRPAMASAVSAWKRDTEAYRQRKKDAAQAKLQAQLVAERKEHAKALADEQKKLVAAAEAQKAALERLRIELTGSAEEGAAREAAERVARVEVLASKAGKRIQNQGIIKGWSMWFELWEEQVAQRQMLAAAGRAAAEARGVAPRREARGSRYEPPPRAPARRGAPATQYEEDTACAPCRGTPTQRRRGRDRRAEGGGSRRRRRSHTPHLDFGAAEGGVAGAQDGAARQMLKRARGPHLRQAARLEAEREKMKAPPPLPHPQAPHVRREEAREAFEQLDERRPRHRPVPRLGATATAR